MLGPESHQGFLVLLGADERLSAIPDDHHALARTHALALLQEILLDAVVGLLKEGAVMKPANK